MTTKAMGARTERSCLHCEAACPQSICQFHLGAPLQESAKLLADILYRSGFEVAYRLSLSRLAKEQLGVETEDVELLFLKHPLVLLQYLFTGGDPALLLPFVAILRAQGASTHVCVCSAWPAEGFRSSGLSWQMAKQSEEKLIQAATHLGESGSKVMVAFAGGGVSKRP